jgi:hypothetical protein
VKVADLLAVDREDLGTFAVREVDGVWVARVVGGGDSHGHDFYGPLVQLERFGRRRFEALLFFLGEIGDESTIDLDRCG